eukprot:908140_1
MSLRLCFVLFMLINFQLKESLPTNAPSQSPSQPPTNAPSLSPSQPPTNAPTFSPTTNPPSTAPTRAPSQPPSNAPSKVPSTAPSNPTSLPTYQPTQVPTAQPTTNPSVDPSADPTVSTVHPTSSTSNAPSSNPTVSTVHPTSSTSNAPSSNPTVSTVHPTSSTSNAPSSNPTVSTVNPTSSTSNPTEPSHMPSHTPSRLPSSPPTKTQTNAPSRPPILVLTEQTNPSNSELEDLLQYEQDLNDLESSYETIFIVFVSLFAIMGLGAWSDAKYIRSNDYLKINQILGMAIQTLDMLSDCFFAINVSIRRNMDSKYSLPMIFAIIFIVLPAFVTIFQLHFQCKRWIHLSDQVREWLSRNLKELYFLSFCTGSAFAAITLVNSYVFQLGLFDMGLTSKELK